VHQSSVKCMLPIANTDNESLVIAGGDDNSLSLTRFWVAPTSSESDTSKTSVMATLRILKAHASTVTAIAILPPSSPSDKMTPRSRPLHQFTLLSSGTDQRLKVWEVRLDIWKAGVEGIEVRRIANEPTSVADVSDMDVFVDEGTRRVIVCGVGMEVWTVDPDGTLCS
jgi:WD repeat-containing protein 6